MVNKKSVLISKKVKKLNSPTLTDKELFYESIAHSWISVMGKYEVNKRLNYVFKKILKGQNLKSKTFLDAGCGIGLFSQIAVKKGAKVTSLEVGKELLKEVKKRTKSKCVVGSMTDLPFEDNTFDFVLATEVIEHTTNPQKAVSELARVTKPGGTLIITVPNRNWYFSLQIANLLKVRPYYGNENWVYPAELKKWSAKNHIEIKQFLGFNIIPFFHPILQPLISFFDRFDTTIPDFMVNIAIVGQKKS